MAAPTLQATGTILGVTSGGVTPTIPTHQADDILIGSTAFWSVIATTAENQPPAGWNQITFLLTPTVSSTGVISWFWRRAAGAGETVTFARRAAWDTGTDTCFAAKVDVIRGCIATGDPWDHAVASAIHSAANGAFAAVTVSGSERLVLQFGISQDNQSLGTATGWTVSGATTTATGTDAGGQCFHKDNQSASTSADATTAAAPAQGFYSFMGISFKPPAAGSLLYTRRDSLIVPVI